jgi:biotin carboxyl carrier protein
VEELTMSRYELDGEVFELRHLGQSVEIDGQRYRIEAQSTDRDGRFEITVDGRQVSGWRAVDGDTVHFWIDGRVHSVTREDPLASGGAAGAGGDEIRADMPGRVVTVECTVGQDVAAGQTLMTTESMKLQVGIVAPRDGRVATLHVAAEQTFDKGAVLVSLEPAPAP